jgi:hypothetical protein
MKNREKPWIDQLIKKHLGDEIPVEPKREMQKQISEFLKTKQTNSERFLIRIRKIFQFRPYLSMVKNGLLTLGFLIGIFVLPLISTAVSQELSTEKFVDIRNRLTLMVALDKTEEVETQIFLTTQNGKERAFTTTWKKGQWIPAYPIKRDAWLMPFLSPDSLKGIIANRLILSRDTTDLTFNILNPSKHLIGKIFLSEDNYLPERLDGVLGPHNEIVKIIYRWKEIRCLSILDDHFNRRKTDD